VSATKSYSEIYRLGANAPARPLLAAGVVLAVLGMGSFVLLALGDDPGRAWRMFHVNFLFFTGVAQGAIIFAATQKITKGVWSGPIIRFAEASTTCFPGSSIRRRRGATGSPSGGCSGVTWSHSSRCSG
jgi:hypothetical protein